MNLTQAIRAAYDADDRYEAAIKAAGLKRWTFSVMNPAYPQALRDAYFTKVDADKAMNLAFIESRRVAS